LKPNRFRKLMAARTNDEILTGFRRVVTILGGTANVRDLALRVLSWTDDEAGDRARTRFAFDYHGASDYAPRTDSASADTISEKA
jgi:CRISPR system Cascade subunit CasB